MPDLPPAPAFPTRSRNTQLWLVLAAVAVTAVFAVSVDLAAVGRVTLPMVQASGSE